jgi:hypothetical protein
MAVTTNKEIVSFQKISRPANNYFTWKNKCVANPKIGRTFINFSRTMDKVNFLIFCFEN